MRRVLVPLDGSDLAASILPEAVRLAGKMGTVILARDAPNELYDPAAAESSHRYAVEQADAYLLAEASYLRQTGVSVEVHSLVFNDAALAIDEAARVFKADMIAAATHGHGPIGRFIHGGTAWKALANSPVPILLQHVDTAGTIEPALPGPPRIMVPLDGSAYAEAALPLAEELAAEWGAAIWLVRCVPAMIYPETLVSGSAGLYPDTVRRDVLDAREYLEKVAGTLTGEVHRHVAYGRVGASLEMLVGKWHITTVVMASHGRTGLSRVIVGSVADELLQHLRCPVVVIPALAAKSAAKRRGVVPVLTTAAGSTAAGH